LDTSATPDRDQTGRFAPGNSGGPGRPRGKSEALRRAAEDAITPDHVAAIIRKATAQALQGNLTAARLVLERTCGRPREAPGEGTPMQLALPRMDTAAGCSHALQVVTDAIVAGTVDLAAAKALVDVIQARLKAIEVQDLEARLVELEKQTAVVDLPRNGRR
jgi:hypothetical protein